MKKVENGRFLAKMATAYSLTFWLNLLNFRKKNNKIVKLKEEEKWAILVKVIIL